MRMLVPARRISLPGVPNVSRLQNDLLPELWLHVAAGILTGEVVARIVRKAGKREIAKGESLITRKEETMLDRKRHIEELLEALWTDSAEQEGKHKDLLTSPHQLQPLLAQPEMEDALREAEERELVTAKERLLWLTERGRDLARDVVRRHRLAERLFHDVLDIGGEEAETSACKIEHLLSPGAADSICILLGHPNVCPHGKAIPSGDCCQQKVEQSRPLVIPAAQLKPGEAATVAYLGGGARGRLDQLAALGLMPGTKVTLQQRSPSYVLNFGQTQLALDESILKEVYVRRSPRDRHTEVAPKRRWGWHTN